MLERFATQLSLNDMVTDPARRPTSVAESEGTARFMALKKSE